MLDFMPRPRRYIEPDVNDQKYVGVRAKPCTVCGRELPDHPEAGENKGGPMCHFLAKVEKPQYHPGGTCLRIETFEPTDRCYLKPSKVAIERNIDPGKWVLSGGDPVCVLEPCVGSCPLKVTAEGGIMNNRKSGPCPVCAKINRREGCGPVKCKECGTEYELV